MKKLFISLENCYGIGTLSSVFDFESGKAYSIYAPNGFMKTSLSKSFLDLSDDKKPTDLIHPDRVTVCDIKDETGADIQAQQIFVIEPYNEEFNSEKTSLLLVNQSLKQQYEDALKKIEFRKDDLLKKLKQQSGLTGRTVTPETELLKCFGHSSIYELFETLESEVKAKHGDRLSEIVYERLFNEKSLGLLDSGKINNQLKDYIEKYNELIDNSPILSKTFNHYHAKTVNKNLVDNGFFSAKHSLNLFNGVVNTKEEITNATDLEAKIEGEKKRILSDDALNQKFEEIDKKLTTKELREFRDYLLDNKDVVAELADYKKLQRDIWFAYLAANRDVYLEFVSVYRDGKQIITQAIDAARQERTAWEEVVAIFNKRFSVPFKLQISNQQDVILKGTAPQIDFSFKDDHQGKSVDKALLMKVLSQGEKRALYILNILFEINARQKQGQETLVIADDIADSFDYKNKYAIVEYLKDVSALDNFYCIFLTHNFDFHRTISSRLHIDREKRFFAVKNGRNLTFKEEKYQDNPFKHWVKNLQNTRFVISAIPFVRNIAEYCMHDSHFKKLTSLLHLKPETATITFQELEGIYKAMINKPDLALPDQGKVVLNAIYEAAETISQENDELAELESKIILSMAVRLKAESYMVKKISDENFVNAITKNQTSALLNKFRENFATERSSIDLLEQVNLMTPENIHINSFMYEPILDMSPAHLKRLYADIKDLSNSLV